MATGYGDIDGMMAQQNEMLEQQRILQDQIVDKGVEKVQNEVNRQKQEYDEEARKNATALYTDYKKQSNPYGANAEQMASMGLNNSGYSESSQVSMYNTYQRNVTELINTTNKLKADADFQMNQAYLEADIQKAQNSITIYQQKANLLLQEYQLKFSRDQFEYQKQRDAVSDSQWERNYQLSLQSSKR